MTEPVPLHPHQALVIQDVPKGDADARPNWSRITKPEHALLAAIGERVFAVLQDHQRQHPEILLDIPPPLRCACDVAVVHLHTPLDLAAFQRANILDFVAEYMTIAKHIHRPLAHWPHEFDTLLKFRRKSLLQRLLS